MEKWIGVYSKKEGEKIVKDLNSIGKHTFTITQSKTNKKDYDIYKK